MLNIKETQSTNVVRIAGLLKELDIEEKKDHEGKEFITAKATIKVDQEVNGKMEENEIVVSSFAYKLTKDGKVSKLYTNPEYKSGILEWKDVYRSLATCPEDQPELASRVLITAGDISENMWADPNSGEMRTTFQINTKFMNLQKKPVDDEASFELSGVILGKAWEVDKQGENTGRLKVQFGVIGFNGRLNVITLIAATEASANYIDSNWNDYDTVTVAGKVSINQSTEVWYEEQGFGEPIKRTKTVSRKELIILGGSPGGLDEELSYDAGDIDKAAEERQARAAEKKEKAKINQRAQAPKNSNKFGF